MLMNDLKALYWQGEKFERVGYYMPTFNKKQGKGNSYMWVDHGKSNVRVLILGKIYFARKVPVTITSTTYQYTTVTRHIDLYFTDMDPNSPQGGKQENAVWNSTTFKKPTYHFSNGETELGEWEYDSGDSYWDSYSAPDYSNIYYYPSESYISGETPTPNSGDNYITIIYNHNYPH